MIDLKYWMDWENINRFNQFQIFIRLLIKKTKPLILGNFFHDDFPTNIVKGKICTMTKIDFTSESEKKELSIKPKLLLITACLLFGFAIIVAYRSSLKNSKYFAIPKIRKNLLRKEFNN